MLQKAAAKPAKRKSSSKISFVSEVEIVYSAPRPYDESPIKSSKDAFAILNRVYDKRKVDYKEFFFVLLLNHANKVIGYSNIGVGNTSCVAVNIKEIFQLALLGNATQIILSHNHPSRELKPSQADIVLTRKASDAAKLFDMTILDHIIVSSSESDYFSFADNDFL